MSDRGHMAIAALGAGRRQVCRWIAGLVVAPAAPLPAASGSWAVLATLALAGGCATERMAAPPPLPPELAKDIVLTAMGFLDTRYRRGGVSETGFDCSGFTRHVYELSTGITLPRTAWEQAAAPALREVAPAAMHNADLVFFNTLARPFSHVGIHVGDGRFIHAPRPGSAVRLEDLRLPYWVQRFDGARRLAAAARERSAPAARPGR